MGNFSHEACPGSGGAASGGASPLWSGSSTQSDQWTEPSEAVRPVAPALVPGCSEKEHGEEASFSPGGIKNWGGVPASEL